MNNVEEESILLKFKKLYRDFPDGVITQPDKPDFIIKGEKNIGIEITQVFKDQDSTFGSLLKAKETFHKYLLENISFNLNTTDFPKCIFSIDLNNKIYSRNLDVRRISKLCIADILIKQEEIKGNGIYEFENSGTLPEIIDGYTISIFDGIKVSEFVVTGSTVGLPLNNNHIQFILDKKEKAKLHFKYCNSYWLLIKEGSREADYFGVSKINKSKLETTFDKVFLIRQRNSEIIELR